MKIARFFLGFHASKNTGHFILLKIRKGSIEKLTNIKKPSLPRYGEYFGQIKRDAIVESTKYRWQRQPEDRESITLERVESKSDCYLLLAK